MAEEVNALGANETNDTVALSGRDAATFEGLMLAYGSLLVMALIPIYLGARRSVAFHENLKVLFTCNNSDYTGVPGRLLCMYT